MILPSALKRWGPPRRQGLCSHPAHLWATSDSAPAVKQWGPPRRQGLCSLCLKFAPRPHIVGANQEELAFVDLIAEREGIQAQ